eukprot:scaffold347572_cov11-Prasinocladus_malaysianus.AAC.1
MIRRLGASEPAGRGLQECKMRKLLRSRSTANFAIRSVVVVCHAADDRVAKRVVVRGLLMGG